MADARNLFILLETAAGYTLFEVVAFEEIGSLLESETVTDLTRFGRAVKLKAFHPFETAQEALENANAIAEHSMTDTLSNFLEMNLPLEKKKSTKTAPWALGVIDPALATSIQEGLGKEVPCRSDDTVREILRGCRYHLNTFVKGLEGTGQKAQLGLGHAYSRSKVKFNPARSDNMIIQSIALLDQMDKDLNTFAMRIREWYSWHFPELKDLVKDNIIFARTAALIQDRSTLVKDLDPSKLEALVEVTGDDEVAKAIVASAKTSMGMDCSAVDMINIINFTQRMVKMAEYRKQLSLYLTNKMSIVAPNLSALIGDTVAARLISKAGSLTNLAKAPASTVQILGAEKALFRALKTKGNTPKYGLIYHSTFIGRADSKNKGRISRYLANKCSIATRIDTFSDEPSRLYGEKLRDQVEERLKFYETGAAPRRNVDVMEEVAKELKAVSKPQDNAMDIDEDEEDDKKSAKKKKKDKKRKSVDTMDVEETKSAKKEKKRKADEDDDDNDDDEEAEEKRSSKKKKKEKKEEVKTPAAKAEEEVVSEKKSDKKKKKKDKKEHGETPKSSHKNDDDDAAAVTSEKKSDKKKKKKSKKDE